MFEQDTIKHHIARSILEYLITHEHARFSEMKPKNTDSNLYSYHLKLLVKADYVRKADVGYTLGDRGLVYVDRVSIDKMRLRSQPKIITMLLVQDELGRVLLQKRKKQPYINTWTLPYGKLHIDDKSVIEAGKRESVEKIGYSPKSLRHVGDCYIVVGKTVRMASKPIDAGELVDGDILNLNTEEKFNIKTRTLAHILRYEVSILEVKDDLFWVKPLQLKEYNLAPAVEQIIARAFFGDEFFFEEFNITEVAK